MEKLKYNTPMHFLEDVMKSTKKALLHLLICEVIKLNKAMNIDLADSEEEILVYAEFDDSVNVGHYRTIHVLGVNESNPVIQMDDTFFTGKYENPVGTYMFFEENPAAESDDPILDKLPEKNLKYLCKTRKLLSMEHAYVTPKEGAEENIPSQPHEEDDEIEAVKFNTIPEALEWFKNEIDCNIGIKSESKSLVTPENVSTSDAQ